MTIIQVGCPDCGHVRLEADLVALREDKKEYHFVCPKCRLGVTKTADVRIVSLLLSAGVVTGVWSEEKPPAVVDDLAPLTVDDLLDFHQQIDEELEALLR